VKITQKNIFRLTMTKYWTTL